MTAPDNRPTVAPVEGWYAVERCGNIVRIPTAGLVPWFPDGSYNSGGPHNYDIIAVIPPDLMAAVADGRVQQALNVAQLHVDRDPPPKGNKVFWQALKTALAAIKGDSHE